MTQRHLVTSDAAACPSCGAASAIVRMRGNGFAATCTECRHTEIAPVLTPAELDDCEPGHEPVVPVQLSYARMRKLGATELVGGPTLTCSEIAKRMADDLPNHLARMAMRFDV